MAYDKIYYFDKINHRRYELGEIQTNFNLNIVIDGDKDSMQIDVHSYSREALQPNTIIYHANDPLQWFVVKKDNVKRNANEQGFYYIHSITLNGAIDLTKNRDLTDCGMNANGYTIDEFFKKLLKLSNFEFDYEIDYGSSSIKNIDKNQKVGYIKSYENYTLLSAIRDFFNGYNCDVKLGFQTITQDGYVAINKAIFKIIPRTGNIELTPIDISDFDDIRESINFDKESYGTTVISNAQNVVSTLAKTYPQVGGVRVTGSDYRTTWQSAYIKLPSPVWRVNWIKLICPIQIRIRQYVKIEYVDTFITGDKYFDFEEAFSSIQQKLEDNPTINQETINAFISYKNKLENIFNKMTITFYNNTTYDPRTDYNGAYGTIVKEEQTPYIAFMDHTTNVGTSDDAHQVAVMDKESAELLKSDKLALVFERGSDKITNLKAIEDMSNIHVDKCDLLGIEPTIVNFYEDIRYEYSVYLEWGYRGNTRLYQQVVPHETCFQVNYIPMSDLKVKQDNENNNNDIQLYNQNGKLNDSVAISKMVDSYSKEITNPTITRYGEYYNLNDIPQIGQIVMDGNTKYVINNISYNLYPCESDDEDEVNYYCECEFTLAEFISTKSIMTSPNTNVRDYGIPQKYNIKRRQVYRDFYEFNFAYDSLANKTKPYAPLENYLYFDTPYVKRDFDHTALIKIEYDSEIGTPASDTWYYQLNSTTYVMNKSVYEVIDFDDNNIIGYDIANSTTGFDMSNLWDSRYIAVTTPVQYVDDNGKFVGITLQMTNAETLSNAYSQVDTQGQSVMFSAHCFINDKLYDLVAKPQNHVNSEETNDTNIFLVTNSQQSFTRNVVVNADDIGIPDYVEIDQNNIVGLVDVNVENGEYQLDSNDYTLSIVSYLSDRRIRVQLSIVADQNKSVIEKLGGTSYDTTLVGSLSINFKVEYIDNTPLSDYVIDEPDYEKDPIEVPVFEYSLQLGDTKDVEVGDNVLLNKECIMCPLTATRSSGRLTPLNATSYEGNLTCDGQSGQYDPQTQSRRFRINAGNLFPVITLEENNTKMRIKFYGRNSWYVDSNEDETIFNYVGEIDPITPSTQQIDKSWLIDNDIVIFKNSIKSLKYKGGLYNIMDFDRDLMFIIHRPTSDDFEGNDLILKINYYKLD